MSAGRGRLWRRVVPPLALLMVLGSAGAVVAQAAEPEHIVLDPLTAAWSPADAGAVAGEAGEVTEAELLGAVQQVEAPVPSASPAPIGPQIEVVLPPPPPPVGAPGSRTQQRAAAAQQKAQAAGITTTAGWCASGPAAVAFPTSFRGLLNAANTERAVWGLAPLTWSDSLAAQATDWSATMAGTGTFDHGNVPSPGGQNIAYYWSSPTAASESTVASESHAGWMASKHGHCDNILRSSFTTMGAGAVLASDGLSWYITVDFQ